MDFESSNDEEDISTILERFLASCHDTINRYLIGQKGNDSVFWGLVIFGTLD